MAKASETDRHVSFLSTFKMFVSLRSRRYIQSAIPSKLAKLQERELAVRNVRLLS
jgi:hypothetical protein